MSAHILGQDDDTIHDTAQPPGIDIVTCYPSLVTRQDLDSRWNRLGSLVIACFFENQEPGASQSAYSNNTGQIPVLRPHDQGGQSGD